MLRVGARRLGAWGGKCDARALERRESGVGSPAGLVCSCVTARLRGASESYDARGVRRALS